MYISREYLEKRIHSIFEVIRALLRLKQRNIQFKNEGVNLGLEGEITNINFSGIGVNSTITGNTLSVDVNGVQGTGTTNYVSKFISATNIGISTIYDDGVNVGVGKTNPLTKLDVAGAIKAQHSIVQVGVDLNTLRGNLDFYGYDLINSPNGAGWVSVTTKSNNNDQLFQIAYDQYASQKIYTRHSVDAGTTWSEWKTTINNDALNDTINYLPKLSTNNNFVDSQIFDDGTSVGVGTNSPQAKLDVVGIASLRGGIRMLPAARIGAGNSFASPDEIGSGFFEPWHPATGNTTIGNTWGPVIIKAGNVDRAIFSENGNVLINQTVDNGLGVLQVEGNTWIGGDLGVGGANGIRTFKNGADVISSTLYIANLANTQAYNFQQNASGDNLELWNYTQGTGWNRRYVFGNNGGLTINSTTAAFIPPRMTTTERNAIVSPIEGSMVYDNVLKVPMFFDGTNWIAF